MANNDNLIPAKKGQVLNPKGRGKGTRNRATIFKELLNQAALAHVKKKQQKALVGEDEELQQGTVADQVAASLLISALAGDTAAAKELMDSGFGKLTDKVDNLHSFTQMGRVEANLPAVEGKKPEAVPLTFDVGSDALHDKPETEET